MEEEYRAATAELARNFKGMFDPSKVDMHKIRTQTARMNNELLLNWADHMYHHEAQTEKQHERVYLVVSDLKLIAASQHYSGQVKWQRNQSKPRAHLFLHEQDVETLHEKHWAVEINGRYYELVRDEDASFFSSANRVEDNDRQIVARIFIGTTHLGHPALKDIGKAVIATQNKYELTRDNCHRFVRVFITLAMCPNHAADTLSNLPLDVEEQLATRGLNQRTGRAGSSGGKLVGKSMFPEDYRYRASRDVGEGIEWVLLRNHHVSELRRTIRQLRQRSENHTEPTSLATSPTGQMKTVYLNEFYVHQEQTSYFIELDPELVSGAQRCHTFDRNPYFSLVRFDKVSDYIITQKDYKGKYKPTGGATGMVTAPYGVTWSNGAFTVLHPDNLIKDKYGVLRNGDGQRLDQPISTWRRMLADLEDFFSRTSQRSFSYRIPAWDLLILKSSQKIFKDNLPWVLLAAASLTVAILTLRPIASSRSSNHPHSRSSSRSPNRPPRQSQRNFRKQQPDLRPVTHTSNDRRLQAS